MVLPHPLPSASPAAPVYRHLRGYALDPSLAQALDTATISAITLELPWQRLAPGPVDDYLEVIDYDPSTRCFYAPVDLDDPNLLAQDGLAPSEGTPQFHQQMVYAVARLTIDKFERALGRWALWSPGPPRDPKRPKDDSHFVPRLRIYPHALREANAYYSPSKKALLFGYFQAPDGDSAGHVPGTMVFTCLSHDIIAHETAHALLDGLHRRLNRPTNPDMLALHEAFADIVALFQHFTFPEILRHQIARTRGDLRSQQNMLGQLAWEFGRATGSRGALRDAIGEVDERTGEWKPRAPDPLRYERTLEPHARGAILVAAVFDAFLSIYQARIADLLRLYTGGTGVLPAGAVHPDLVNRLSDEAAKSARHVLNMCVRALDYCPPVDLTFGEYLRAIITADKDIVPDDSRNYRVAFAEAFRRHGLYPRDVRTLSVENLLWRGQYTDDLQPSDELHDMATRLREHAHRQLYAKTREEVFDCERQTRYTIHERLSERFRDPAGKSDATFLGVDPALPFEVHTAHFAARTGPRGDVKLQLIMQIIQEREAALDPSADGRRKMRFDGGCTVVVNLEQPAFSYVIRKPIGSATRMERQRDFARGAAGASLRATYLGARPLEEQREPFAVLHRGTY